jgi:hypothetical protein
LNKIFGLSDDEADPDFVPGSGSDDSLVNKKTQRKKKMQRKTITRKAITRERMGNQTAGNRST